MAVVVVHVQPIGNAAEAADRLETLHHPCLDPVARPLNLGRIRSLVAEAIQLFIERRLDFFRRVAGPRSDRNVEHRAECQRRLPGCHVLRDLLLVHKLFVQPARFSPAQDVGRDVGLSVAGAEDGRGQPGDVHARQLDVILDDKPALGRNRRRLHPERRHVGPPLERPEVLFDQPPGRRLVDVPHDREARIVRRVIQLEELLHVVEARSLNVGVRSDDARIVGMCLREERVVERLFDDAVRLVLDRLAPLVADDILLIRKVRLVQLVDLIPHAIRLEPERQLELAGRQGFEVVGPIEVRRPVDAASPRAFEHLEVHVRGDVLRTLAHQAQRDGVDNRRQTTDGRRQTIDGRR